MFDVTNITSELGRRNSDVAVSEVLALAPTLLFVRFLAALFNNLVMFHPVPDIASAQLTDLFTLNVNLLAQPPDSFVHIPLCFLFAS